MSKKKHYPLYFNIHDFSVDKIVIPSGVYSSQNGEIEANKVFTFDIIKADCIFVVTITIKLMQHSKQCLTLKTSTKFKFEKSDFDTYFNKATSKYIFNTDFVSHLVTIALSTTRGFLFSKTEGLSFKNYLLPASNLDEFIKSDVIL